MRAELSKYFNNDNLILLDRAFLGLYAAFQVLKRKTEKRKILFTSTTCPSPVFAAVFAGLTPVFTDINMSNYLMDLDEVKNIIDTDKDIAAIVYIYTFGHICTDILEIRDLAKSKNICLIEDVAQAFGCGISGNEAGTIGDLSVFSFGYSKQINAGDGGALMINSSEFTMDEIQNEILHTDRYIPDAELQNEYRDEFYHIRKLGIDNAGLYSLYSKFPDKYRELYFRTIKVDWDNVRDKFTKFVRNNEKISRIVYAHAYQEGLTKNPYAHKFSLPDINEDCCIYRYTFMLKDKHEAKALSDYLRKNNINCSNLYVPVSRFYNNKGFENAVKFAEGVINLWVDDTIDKDYINATLSLIECFYKNNSIKG
ncbi:MAG: DegT/DnrJ/EryC1/StrS family aminotransferase [Clostridia bacterium]|nr:DegT/DnrJ/EryC1/StrS family aminotransferase [Clostridia bacterium]